MTGASLPAPTGNRTPLPSQLLDEVLEDVGAEEEGEDEAVDGAPEVGRVADVVHVPTGHIQQ